MRESYHQNPARIRAQQSRYNEARRAWKYAKRNLTTELFGQRLQDSSLTIISELELRFPSYITEHGGRRKWETWDTQKHGPLCAYEKAHAAGRNEPSQIL